MFFRSMFNQFKHDQNLEFVQAVQAETYSRYNAHSYKRYSTSEEYLSFEIVSLSVNVNLNRTKLSITLTIIALSSAEVILYRRYILYIRETLGDMFKRK